MTRQDDPTSGQVGPKSKLQSDSEKPRPSERLRPDEEPKAAKSKLRADKTGSKLEQARKRLAAQKPKKPPGIGKKAVRQIRAGTWQYLHGKIHQVEHENAGVEGAHKSELATEGGMRRLSRYAKKRWNTRPARLAEKWERKNVRANTKWEFQKMAQEHPTLKSNVLSRAVQKHKLKQQYAKKARQTAKQGAKAAGKVASYTEKAARAVGGVILRHPVGALIVAAAVLVGYLLCSVFSLFPLLGGGMTGTVESAAAYTAADADIMGAEADYSVLEEALRRELAGVEAAYTGYDEYRRDVDGIGHDPHELAAYLSAKYGADTRAGVQEELRALFNEQYVLTLTEAEEQWADTDGNIHVRRVLYITLRNRSLSDLAGSRLNAEQKELYDVMLELKGNRPDLWNERSAYEQ